MRKQVILGVVALCSIVAVFQTPGLPQDLQAIQRGGTLVVATNADPENLNATISVGPVDLVGCKTNEGLGRVSSDFVAAYPQLARFWHVSADGLTYTFRLQKDVTWHDGKPFTSADVKFTFEQMSPLHPRSRRWMALVSRIDVPDDQTVIVRLKEPYAPLLLGLECSEAAISPKHIYDGTDIRSNAFNRKPVGTGPFKFARWDPGDRIELVRNDRYWKKGLPYLDRVIVKVIPDTQSMILGLQRGDIDYISNLFVPKAVAARLAGQKGIGIKLGAAPADSYFLALNLAREPFSRTEVRRALMLAIDRDLIAKNVFARFGVAAARAPISESLKVASNPDVDLTKLYPYSVSRANEALDRLGLPRASGGKRFKVELTYEPGRLSFEQVAEIVARAWEKVGIEVKLVPAERQIFLNRVFQKRDFDVALLAYTTSGDPAIGVSRLFLCEKTPVSFGNPTGYCRQDVDKLFVEGQLPTKLEARNKVYRRLQEILATDLPALQLVTAQSVDLYNSHFVFDSAEGPGPTSTHSMWSGWEYVYRRSN